MIPRRGVVHPEQGAVVSLDQECRLISRRGVVPWFERWRGCGKLAHAQIRYNNIRATWHDQKLCGLNELAHVTWKVSGYRHP